MVILGYEHFIIDKLTLILKREGIRQRTKSIFYLFPEHRKRKGIGFRYSQFEMQYNFFFKERLHQVARNTELTVEENV